MIILPQIMNKGLTYSSRLIVFKEWSGKAYSVFASLGEQIRIGHIAFDICDKALLKDKNLNSLFINLDDIQENENEESDDLIENLIDYQIATILLNSKLDISSRQCCRTFTLQIITFFNLCGAGCKILLSKSINYDR